ncbi:DUF1003 domain-containing protein [Tessaracoccus sp. SD287]|uniref:DUF1003 domain-containing protein n=1 Tax=Tessaracoccus sp. SD287 TaxID=2782008 RepID=UPI001A96E30D|nr:DUF1003 domain-containing protein [Tessaracoccus sp. SD287]
MAEIRNDEVRLDQPVQRAGFRWRRPSFGSESFGSFAEWVARFMGTPTFLLWMTIFVIVWITLNVIGLFGYAWDPYPFILLNLAFSTQASYSAPLILLAQNRQESRDRLGLEEDRRVAQQSRADMDFLAREIASLRMSVNELATRDYIRSEVRAELRELVADLDKRVEDR